MTRFFFVALLVGLCSTSNAQDAVSPAAKTNLQTFSVRGVVKEIKTDHRLVVQHEAIPDFMDAMTMPFRVKDATQLAGIKSGDAISFRLLVTAEESWIEQIQKIAGAANILEHQTVVTNVTAAASSGPHPLMDYKFTNQLNQPVSLSDFKGKALAITFIFTRCPIPEYCPRLTKNFQQVYKTLSAMPNAPTNWHLLSVTIDPAFDTPAVLKKYAERSGYDPAHWSFLTGAKEKVLALARESGVTIEADGDLFQHNFKTLIVDTEGRLQQSIPIGGDISEMIARELLENTGRQPPMPRVE